MTSRLAGEIITDTKYNGDIDLGPKGLLARAERVTSSSTTTTTIGVLRLDDVQLEASRAYLIVTSPLNVDSSTGTDDVKTKITFTADGSTPTTGSTTLPETIVGGDVGGGGTGAPIMPITALYQPTGGAELLSLLLCVTRTAGAGNAYIYGDATQKIQITVHDLGLAVSDAGTDI